MCSVRVNPRKDKSCKLYERGDWGLGRGLGKGAGAIRICAMEEARLGMQAGRGLRGGDHEWGADQRSSASRDPVTTKETCT